MAASPAVDLESVGFTREPARTDWLILGGLTLLTFIVHLVFYKGYGFFRDELYFIACGNHLGWAACAWIAARILAGESPKLWLLFGLFAGLALQGKHAMAFFGLAFVTGLLISPQREILLSPWLWFGGMVTFLIALPNLFWEYGHDWATYELLSNIAKSDKNIVLNPLQYLLSNVLTLSPLTFPVWVAGLLWFLLAKDGLRFRALGSTWIVSFLLFVALKGKDYYLAPVYPMLFAGGAVAIEALFATYPEAAKRNWLKPVFAVCILLVGIVLWPFAMPMMSVEKFIAYEKALGAAPKKKEYTQLSQMSR